MAVVVTAVVVMAVVVTEVSGRRFDDDRGGRGSRPNPFARPAKPQPEAPG